MKFELTEQTRQSVDGYLRDRPSQPGGFLFPGRTEGSTLSTRQFARLLQRWLTSIDIDPSAFGTHSLRRTKATLIYRRTGNLRAVQLLLGHTKIESTVRYLGVEVDDALNLADRWISELGGGAAVLHPSFRQPTIAIDGHSVGRAKHAVRIRVGHSSASVCR